MVGAGGTDAPLNGACLPKDVRQIILSEHSRGELFILNYLSGHGGIAHTGEIRSHTVEHRPDRDSPWQYGEKGLDLSNEDDADHCQTQVRLMADGMRYVLEMCAKALESVQGFLGS